MRKLTTLLVALVAFAAMASTASANTIQSRPAGSITSVSLGKLTFHSSISDVLCNVTLRGRLLTEAVSNTAETKIGEITAAEITSCEGAAGVTVLNLPWTMRLTATYTGPTLSFKIVNASFNLEQVFGGLECLYQGNANASAEVISSVTGLVTSAANSVPRAAGQSFFCPSEGKLVGRFNLEPRQTISTI
jgi:hypothetical protein